MGGEAIRTCVPRSATATADLLPTASRRHTHHPAQRLRPAREGRTNRSPRFRPAGALLALLRPVAPRAAHIATAGRLPQAWIAPAEIRELRTSCKDQVHAVLAKLGIPVTCTDIFGVWGNTWLDGLALPQPYAGKVASLRTLAGELTAEITVLEAAIADLLAHHDGYHAIRALPGIGQVLGAVLVAEIGDITRFGSPARLCSWAGLTPAIASPGTKVSRGHITKQGSPLVRWALVEAIQHVPAGHPLRRRKEDIIARRGA
jgi:transposase